MRRLVLVEPVPGYPMWQSRDFAFARLVLIRKRRWVRNYVWWQKAHCIHQYHEGHCMICHVRRRPVPMPHYQP